MANSDGTLLCIFSGSACIIVDDFAQKVQQTLQIGTIWPELAAWGMDRDLDAVCRDDTIGQFIFFKGGQCAVNNFKQKKWSHGMQGNYFILPLPQDNQSPRFSGTICAAIEDAGTISLHAHDPIHGKRPQGLHQLEADDHEQDLAEDAEQVLDATIVRILLSRCFDK